MNEDTRTSPLPEVPLGEEKSPSKGNSRLWIWITALVLIVAAVAAGVYFLFQTEAGVTAQIRDVFIIFMALEALIIGVALVVLIIQVTSLINLVQNEVKPILKSTTDTVNTLKGTTDFLSENLVEPVIKMSGSLAGLKRLLDLFKIVR